MTGRDSDGFPPVARVFFASGLLGGGVVALGLLLALLEGSVRALFAWPSLRELWHHLSSFTAEGVLGLGLALLLLLPIARNVAVVVAMLRRRQVPAAALALLVVLLLVALYTYLSFAELVAFDA